MESAFQVGHLLLGKYRVERVLGRGGMGYVLAVRHIELDELFAIKLLNQDALRNTDAVGRFVREARAAAHLKSEHVAKVLDVGHFEDGAVYMVMEHLDGSDLSEVLRVRGSLPVDEAITYVLQACEAISEAHAAGFVHRDLKPANLFLTWRPNGTPCIKVLDFGIAKQRDSIEPELTLSGVMLGSPRYMSPEQMRRTKTVDARGDVWSMGAVLYKLLTGVVPFRGESVPEIISSVLSEEPEAPSNLRCELPTSLDAFLACALEKQPEHRFQSIEEFATALSYLRDEISQRLSISGATPAPSPRRSQSHSSAHSQSHSPAHSLHASSIPPARRSQPHDHASVIPPPRRSQPHGHAIPPARRSQPHAQRPPVIPPARRSHPGQERTAVVPRMRHVPHEPSSRSQDETRVDGTRTLNTPLRRSARTRGMAAAVAAIVVVAFGSAWVVRGWRGPGAAALGILETTASAVSTGTQPAPEASPTLAASAAPSELAPAATAEPAALAPTASNSATASSAVPAAAPAPRGTISSTRPHPAKAPNKDIRPHR